MFYNFIPSFREVLLALSTKIFLHPPSLRRRLPSLFAYVHNSLPGQTHATSNSDTFNFLKKLLQIMTAISVTNFKHINKVSKL